MITENTRKILVGLLAVKIMVISAVWLFLNGRLRIGDAPLSAAEEAVKVEEKKQEENPKVEEKKESKRKSFLSDLLELPSLNPDALKKEDAGRYLSMADKKRKQLDERVELIKRREEQLINLEKSIDAKVARIEDEKRYIEQTIQKEKDLKGERLARLIELYDKMEPKKAAPLFASMDKDLAVSLLKSLKQKQSMNILENMPADKSVVLTEYFGRIRSMREYDTLRELNVSLQAEFDKCKGLPVQPGDKSSQVSPASSAPAPSLAMAPSTAPEGSPSETPSESAAPSASP